MQVWFALRKLRPTTISSSHYNVAGQSQPINIRDEVLSELAKSSLALGYLVGSLRSIPLLKKDGASGADPVFGSPGGLLVVRPLE
jgi:hypothetical protein